MRRTLKEAENDAAAALLSQFELAKTSVLEQKIAGLEQAMAVLRGTPVPRPRLRLEIDGKRVVPDGLQSDGAQSPSEKEFEDLSKEFEALKNF